MKHALWKRGAALLLAFALCLSLLPAQVFALNPALNITPAPGFSVYKFNGEIADATTGEKLTDAIDLSDELYFITGNNVQMGGLCLWPVTEDELPPATICNSGYNDKVYSDDLLALAVVSSSSVMAGTILGQTVGYDWDTGKFTASEGYHIRYFAAGEYYPEPGKYRFLMFYSNSCYYSDVYTITDRTNLTANQGVLEATWLSGGKATSIVPYDAETEQASFDLSLSLPKEVQGIGSVRLLRADYDMFGSDSYYWFGVNDPNSSFQVGQLVNEGEHGDRRVFTLKNCTIKNMSRGSYRVKVISGSNKHYIDNTVTLVREVSADPPEITTASLPNGKAGAAYYAQMTAVPVNGGAISWSVRGKLPDGLTLDPSTGTISGTPTKEGTYPFIIRADEEGSGYAEKDYTVVIAEPDLAMDGEGCFWYNSVEEQIQYGSDCVVTMYLNRSPSDSDTASATVYYTTTGNAAKTLELPLTMYSWAGASTQLDLPNDAKRVDRVEYFLNGEKVGTKTVNKTVAPALELTISGNSAQYLYLTVYNSGGEVVCSRGIGTQGTTLTIKTLPSGTYRAMLSGTVSGFGYQNFGELTFTLQDGAAVQKTLPVTMHYVTCITVHPRAEGQNWPNARIEWFADAAGTQKVQEGETRRVLDDEAYWVRVTPQYSASVMNLPSALTRVDRGDSTTGAHEVTVNLPRKPATTVRLNVLLSQLDGSAPAPGWYSVTATKYGAGTWNENQYYERNGEAITFTDLTEGARITVSGSLGRGSVSYTVTAADAAKDSIDLTLTVPLADGLILWNATQTDAAGTRPFNSLGYVESLKLYKADGTELSIIRQNGFLLLSDPDAVSFGETLKLVGWRGDRDYPYCYGETQLQIVNDGGRKTASAIIPMLYRSKASFTLERGMELPSITMLIYAADGSLIYERRNIEGTSTSPRIGCSTPYLPAGAYYVGAAPAAYLDGLDAEAYDTAAEFVLLPHTVLQQTGLLTFTPIDLGTMELPEGFRAAQWVNLALSGVSARKADNECFRLDVNVMPLAGFTWDSESYNHKNVELYIVTNQAGTNSWGGHVSTRALSVNGKPLEIDRWSQNGMLQDNGTITLSLTPEQINELGGFPLSLATTCYQTKGEALEAKAYLRYWSGGSFHSDFIGQVSEATGALTLTAPTRVTDGSFTVYGRGPASLSDNLYTLTLFMNGQPVAFGVTDNKQGYYRIHVDLPEDQLAPLQSLHFSVSGSYADGLRALSSEEKATLYDPEGAQVQTMTLNWESHAGDFEAGHGQSMLMLNDGDAPQIYGMWYRSGGSTDLAKVFWSVTFDGHPEKVQAARVYVPRNGTTKTYECVKQPDGSWATEPTYFFGAAPDGAWVEFDCPVEYGYVSDPDGAITEEDVTQFMQLLSGGEAATDVTGSPLGDGMLSFLLSDDDGNQLPLGFSIQNYPWDESEVQELRELELDPHTPNLLRHTEDWMTFGEGDSAFTVWAYDTITRYVNHDDNSKHFYQEEIYTPDFRMIRSFDEATQTKQVSILTVGALNYQDMDLGTDFADEGAHSIARSSELQRVWTIFYEQFGAAMMEAIEALNPENPEPTKGLISDVSFLKTDEKRGPSTKEIQDAINKLKKQKEAIEQKLDDPSTKIVQDSYNWAHGEEITQAQIRRVKDFLDDNPCLKRLYRFWRSGTNDANNPYRVIAEADSVYFKVGVEGIAKILEEAVNSTSYFEGGAKDAAKKLGDALYKGSVERAYDGWKGMLYDADIFDRQIENLCQDLYIAAKRAEREERGIGGLCNEGIKWNRFPIEYYDYYKYFGYGPRSYSHVTPPPGPQGRYDPSGYVYEAVPSNRVEGAEVTLWQLEGDVQTTVDDSGVATTLSGGTPILTDAELFGLEPNPQTTGEDGRYQWFVPSGWWRVKVTKNGYENADTGTSAAFGVNTLQNDTDGCYYMPVLPEQLDVNIPLVSYEAPMVERFVANTRGVFVSFTKYMDETSLTQDRFTLVVNGKVVETTLELTDSEKSSAASDAPSYTRMVRMTYPGIAEGDRVRIVIDNRVTSYAGVCMDTRFDMSDITVRAPAQTPAPTASVPAGEVEENTPVFLRCAADGAVIRYTLDGTDPTQDSPIFTDAIVVTGETVIKAYASRADRTDSETVTFAYTLPAPQPVVERVRASVDGAPVADGDTVKPGMLTFSCRTEGAEIWYTTNGVCPCDDETAKHQYTDPIELTAGTYFFRVRALKDGVWSDGLGLHLTVEAEQPPQPKNPFVDVVEGKFYYNAVLWAVNYTPQITNGVDATHFVPNGTCTRGQIVTFLWRAKGCPAPTSTENVPFTDLKQTGFYYQAVLWAVENNITAGLDKTHFGPNEPCTRGQVVTFLWRTEGKPTPTVTSTPFTDLNKSAFYYQAVLWAVENKITSGVTATTFEPGGTCTRGQIVTFLYRDLEK